MISGISKIIDLNSFQKTLKVIYIPEFFVTYISFLLPIFEIFLGIFLSIGILTRFISIVMFLLVVIFTIMISIQMIIGNSVECNCFGSLTKSKMDGLILYWFTVNWNFPYSK